MPTCIMRDRFPLEIKLSLIVIIIISIVLPLLLSESLQISLPCLFKTDPHPDDQIYPPYPEVTAWTPDIGYMQETLKKRNFVNKNWFLQVGHNFLTREVIKLRSLVSS